MASRIMPDNPKVFGPETKFISFQFFPQAGSTTPLTTANGFIKGDVEAVANVTRTATAGEFQVNLVDAYVKVLCIQVTLEFNALTDVMVQLGPITSAGTATPLSFLVRCKTPGGAAADIAANANNIVHVFIALRDSAENVLA